jgi:hypothetical protein
VGKRRRSAAAPERDRRATRRVALAIFVAALASRFLFALANSDRAQGWTAWFKGDAPLWLDWARAIDLGDSFELGLPIHPPGAAYLAALLWDGRASGIGSLSLGWIFFGALVPVLVFLAAERSFGLRVAAVAGSWTALSSGLLVLSTSVNNETPYLVLAIGSLWFVEDLKEVPKTGRLAAWSAVNAIACLFRVEHVLFWILTLLFFGIGWRRRGAPRALAWTGTALLCFALPLVPWHSTAWNAIRRFNEEPRQPTPVEEQGLSRLERRLAGITWTAEARREREKLPAFVRRTASAFVLATVAHRGGREVRGEDFRVLDEAFGYRPRPLRRFPFVSSYGPLNFALANHAAASGGFDRSPLEEPPPLEGGASRYPAFLVQGLPPSDLAFVYPGHLRLFNEGYSIGLSWIAQRPVDFARLAGRKLAIFWSGAASGLTGWNLPIGQSGLRRPVDMVTPDAGVAARAWRIAVLVVCLAGLVVGRRRSGLPPWLLFLASRLAATILFFGYARAGATTVPVVALLVGIGLEKWRPRIPPARLAAGALAIGVALEATRFAAKPRVSMDGIIVGDRDPFSRGEHDAHRVEVRFR